MKIKFLFGRFLTFLGLLLFCATTLFSQNNSAQRNIGWQKPIEQNIEGTVVKFLQFNNSELDASQQYMPYYVERFENVNANIEYAISNPQFAEFEFPDLIFEQQLLSSDIKVNTIISYNRKQPVARIKFIPLRINSSTGKIEKLVSFNIVTNQTNLRKNNSNNAMAKFANQSVLASGEWFTVSVASDGVYKITYDFLKRKLKINPEDLITANIKIFSNGGGMLPFANSVPRPDDLQEIAIKAQGLDDGKFDKNDFIAFYGQGPVKWKLNTADNRFHHQLNLYSDSTFYFINIDGAAGKRILPQAGSSLSPSNTATTFDDYQFYEDERQNFIKSGREWFGKQFDVDPDQSFKFNFPHLTKTVPVYVQSEFAGRTFNTNVFFDLSYNGTPINKLKVTSFFSNYLSDFCALASSIQGNSISKTFNATTDDVAIDVKFTRTSSNANGWLNYIEMNATRDLIFTGSQMFFRNKESAGAGKVTNFIITTSSSNNIRLWDVTSHDNVFEQQFNSNGGNINFVVATDSLREYVLFSESEYKEPLFGRKVENQNIHAEAIPKMVIVTHPQFIDEAEQLAKFHRDNDGLSTLVVTTEQVYNEFSSGAPDVSAIRDMMRMFYKKSIGPQDMPKYLLLIGDGSYDNKNREYSTNNLILTWQSASGCSFTGSYVTDDFFGLLDDDEGNVNSGEEVDIGIGRFPVFTNEQAQVCVDKVINYSTEPGYIVEEASCNNGVRSPLGDWRNTICYVGDDEDSNTHLQHNEIMVSISQQLANEFTVDKIYFDAFQQISTPGGKRYPSVKDAITKRVERGSLLINYAGHGGETGWSEERVLEVSDVRGWKNANRLPIFVTATCEFSRFDDPGRTSAGELILINSENGGIGLFTTTRVAYTNTNLDLNKNLIQSFFNFTNGKPRLGDIMRYTKALSAQDQNRNFCLLGDPAVVPAFPEYKLSVTQINDQPAALFNDTLKALSNVKIKGVIKDASNNIITNYKGVVYPTIYDKTQKITTLSNDPASPATQFLLRKNVLYKGKAEIKNGEFEFTFMVPKDIDYTVGLGRISLYAQDGKTDAMGVYDSAKIGAINPSPPSDSKGPSVELFMNNENFNMGGTTDANPRIYAVLNDEYGINTVGNGIGHDITATLDNQTQNIFTLNDYYQGDLNNSASGKVIYPLYNIANGNHTLTFKVWDIFNNSSEAKTEFVVASEANIALNHVLNYPNPFTTNTRFMFDHNQACNTLLVEIKVFTVSGKVVKQFNQIINCEGYHEGIQWDGRDDFGDRLGRGVYLYKVKISDVDGKSAEKIEKLVLLR